MNYTLVAKPHVALVVKRLVIMGLYLPAWGGRAPQEQLARAFIRQIYVGTDRMMVDDVAMSAGLFAPDATDLHLDFPTALPGMAITLAMRGGWCRAFGLCSHRGLLGLFPINFVFSGAGDEPSPVRPGRASEAYTARAGDSTPPPPTMPPPSMPLAGSEATPPQPKRPYTSPTLTRLVPAEPPREITGCVTATEPNEPKGTNDV